MLKVKHIARDLNLEVMSGEVALDRPIESDLLSRPGVEIAGFFDYFDEKRIVLIGSKEATFMSHFEMSITKSRVENLIKKKPPCIVFSRNVYIPDFFYEFGHFYGVPILRSTHYRTTELVSLLYDYLHSKLAPRKTLHGVLVDIHGIGTLIMGKSGIGKSETALELIKRGHLLVADDRVDIFEASRGVIVGYAPNITRQLIEVRGIGIVNVVTMFGAGAYRENKKIRLIVELEKWDDNKAYDRLGLDEDSMTLFNTVIPKITIPVLPGRNVATLVETAADNQKLKYLGYKTAEDFIKKVDLKAKGELDDEELDH